MEEKYASTFANIKRPKIMAFVYRYSIRRNNKWVENGLIGWRTALAHARKHTRTLFDDKNKPIKIEILNIWTGEIITLEEAEKRAAKCAKRSL